MWRVRLENAARVAVSALLLGGVVVDAQTPLALVPVDAATDGGVKVAGAIEVSGGHAIIGSSGSVTAGDRTASILLPGKGELRVCSTTTIHLSRDRSVSPAPAVQAAAAVQPASPPATSVPPKALSPATGATAPGALMMALDRGALEANFTTGKYSDVLMTPDFRMLISGPGFADVRVRVSQNGDTCVENRGDHAPYLTVSSQLEDGVYRVQPNQRVLFEHGSLREVVDHESEPCGCPAPPLSIASSGSGGAIKPPSFPLAESEGLAPVPAPTAPTGVARGETQTQVTVPLAYNGAAPPPVTAAVQPAVSGVTPAAQSSVASPNSAKTANMGKPEVSTPRAGETGISMPSSVSTSTGSLAAEPGVQPEAEKPKATSSGVFHRIGRFFSHLFGR